MTAQNDIILDSEVDLLSHSASHCALHYSVNPSIKSIRPFIHLTLLIHAYLALEMWQLILAV